MKKRYEEVASYIAAGITSYADILADCEDIARTDAELRTSMEQQAGSVAEYAREIYAAVQEEAEKHDRIPTTAAPSRRPD